MLRHLQAAGPVPPGILWIALLVMPCAHATEPEWTADGEAHGVPLEWRPSDVGPRTYRGSTVVCTDLETLRRFVTDASRLEEWIPQTEAAWAVPAPERQLLYYLRTDAPWPFKSRDMVYRLTLEDALGDTVRLRLEGAPEAAPEQDGVVRMQAVEGGWVLAPGKDGIVVTFRLAVDPGRLPGFLVNRRLAATVGGSLANLAERFPCESPP